MEFPCQYPIKVMGKDTLEFRALTLEIIESHYLKDTTIGTEGELESTKQPQIAITERLSTGAKYISLTYTIPISSRPKLESIYKDLKACELVVMTL